ncbi:MAG: glutaredoxin family protein [Methanoregulaceae archaeon]|nr:glutaredoxin family protein [Methanoregulaceae archaeon]
MSQVIVYTLKNCPNCEALKEFLNGRGVPYQEQDMSSATSLTELRVNGIFVNEAPVLRRDERFFTSRDLFSRGSIREEEISTLLEGE